MHDLGDMGILGTLVARDLDVPLVASWHTNVHEFGARRLERLLALGPAAWRRCAAGSAERAALDTLMWFYSFPHLLFAPNRESIEMLAARTGTPVLPMWRGVDTSAFSPSHRARQDSEFVLGFAGRLRPEKNVRFLAEVENALIAAGHTRYRFLICGEGSERPLARSAHAPGPFLQACYAAPLLRAHSPIWTCSSSHRRPTPTAMWFRKRWHPACPRW